METDTTPTMPLHAEVRALLGLNPDAPPPSMRSAARQIEEALLASDLGVGLIVGMLAGGEPERDARLRLALTAAVDQDARRLTLLLARLRAGEPGEAGDPNADMRRFGEQMLDVAAVKFGEAIGAWVHGERARHERVLAGYRRAVGTSASCPDCRTHLDGESASLEERNGAPWIVLACPGCKTEVHATPIEAAAS